MSIAKSQDQLRNPSGFGARLETLMSGWGFSLRDVATRSGVSHGTIKNWLDGTTQARIDQVDAVARVFGWTGAELLHGEPPANVMDRLAALYAFRARVAAISGELADAVGGRWIAALEPGLPGPENPAESDEEIPTTGPAALAHAVRATADTAALERKDIPAKRPNRKGA